MLTSEQLEERTRGIGASDAHVLLGVDGPGGRTLLDLWSTKRRGKNLEQDPVAQPRAPEDSAEHFAKAYAQKSSPLVVGNAFESSVVALYENQTGYTTSTHPTMQHPEIAWARANPDRVILGEEGCSHGLECKMVGRWATDRWENEEVPGYVVAQAQWCMGVSGLGRWDCAAWIAGTEARVVPVYRDDALIKMMFELGEAFWVNHVLADSPPPPAHGEDLIRFLGRRFAKDDGQIVELTGEAGAQAAAIAKQYDKLRNSISILEKLKKESQAKLIALTREHKGICGSWGRFTYGGRAGRVSWKKIAEELAGGAVDDDTIERHRGAGYRQADLRMLKEGRLKR